MVAEATLLGFLFKRKLLSRYPWFAAFLAVEWLQMVALIELPDGSPLYSQCWALSEIVLLLAMAGAAIEITKKILGYYPEIKDFASSSFEMLFLFGCVAATVLGVPFLKSSLWQPTQAYLVTKILFWESITLFVFLLAQALWFKMFPIRMKSNVSLHRWLLAFYAGGIPGAWSLLMDWLDRRRAAKAQVNLIMMAIEVCLLAAWCLWFTQEGEKSPEDGKRLEPFGHNRDRKRVDLRGFPG